MTYKDYTQTYSKYIVIVKGSNSYEAHEKCAEALSYFTGLKLERREYNGIRYKVSGDMDLCSIEKFLRFNDVNYVVIENEKIKIKYEGEDPFIKMERQQEGIGLVESEIGEEIEQSTIKEINSIETLDIKKDEENIIENSNYELESKQIQSAVSEELLKNKCKIKSRKELEMIFPKHIIIMKYGDFYNAYGKCAEALSFYTDYKLVKANYMGNSYYKCGGPSLDNIEIILKAEDVSYIVVDKDIIVSKYDAQNPFDRFKFSGIKKQEVKVGSKEKFEYKVTDTIFKTSCGNTANIENPNYNDIFTKDMARLSDKIGKQKRQHETTIWTEKKNRT